MNGPRRAAWWWLAAVIAALVVADPVAGQIHVPDMTANAPPRVAVAALKRHLDERKKRMDEPLTVPEEKRRIEGQLESEMFTLACLLAIEDLVGDLRKYGHRTYPRGSDDRQEFDKELAGLDQALGTAQERAARFEKGMAKIDALKQALGETPDRTAILHDLYHATNAKKRAELVPLNLVGELYRPLAVWGVIECEEECTTRLVR